jgi:aminopeptidase N
VVLNSYNTSRDDWIIANIKHSGFYRVNYDAHNWQLLVNQLNSDRFELIDVINRASLIDDSFNLGRAELVDQTLFLDIVKYLRNETSSIPFETASDGLYFIKTMFGNDYQTSKSIQVT